MNIADFKRKILVKATVVTKIYYNDPPAVPPPPPPPAVPPVVPPPPPPGKTFSQQDVDKLMADHRKGLQDQNKELIGQLEELRNNKSLTEQEKEALQARIDTLGQQHLTKEQQAQEAYNKLQKKSENDRKQLEEASVVWKSRFERVLVDNAIAVAASQHKARSAVQLQMMFANQAKVVEELGDDGKPTGNWVPKMMVETVDEKTKQRVKLELPLVEAIGKIRENEAFANLFDIDGKGGYGGNNHQGGGFGGGGQNGPPDFSKMTPDAYAKWRKDNAQPQGYSHG